MQKVVEMDLENQVKIEQGKHQLEEDRDNWKHSEM